MTYNAGSNRRIFCRRQAAFVHKSSLCIAHPQSGDFLPTAGSVCPQIRPAQRAPPLYIPYARHLPIGVRGSRGDLRAMAGCWREAPKRGHRRQGLFSGHEKLVWESISDTFSGNATPNALKKWPPLLAKHIETNKPVL